jgi:putative ABC transport system ATP-binding protein
MGQMSVLEARELYRFYHSDEEETVALRGVSLHAHAGEIVAIIGPSGSGKSTLLNCLSGLDEPNGGSVFVAGERLTRRPEPTRARIRAQCIGILLQSGNLFSHLRIEENIELQMRLANRLNRARITELLTAVGIESRRRSLPSQISGGEAARAGLATALAADPPLLIADEPTAEVDAGSEERILRVLQQRKQQGGATIIATHSAAVAAFADRVLHLVDGRTRA